MTDIEIAIGDLRWLVTVARRRQNFDLPGGVSIYEDLIEVEKVHADVRSVSGETFYGQEQTDTPVTTRITTRWLGYLDNSYVIIRETKIRHGHLRVELFRIRRVKELNGRKRWSSIECETEEFTVHA